jgi:hypothetical protein
VAGTRGPSDAPLKAVSAGLDKVKLLKVGDGYFEALAGWSTYEGPMGRLEAGARLGPHSSAFGYAHADVSGAEAGAGWRYEW